MKNIKPPDKNNGNKFEANQFYSPLQEYSNKRTRCFLVFLKILPRNCDAMLSVFFFLKKATLSWIIKTRQVVKNLKVYLNNVELFYNKLASRKSCWNKKEYSSIQHIEGI